MEEEWDVESLDALRGYAPLSRDATTAKELDWQHLKHESKQDARERSDSGDTIGSTSDMTEDRSTTPEVAERSRPVSLYRIRMVQQDILTNADAQSPL
jgi:hypothetical protein